MKFRTTANENGTFKISVTYNFLDTIRQTFYSLICPFRKSYIQYTTLKRYLKAVLCYYILDDTENYLVFGGWEKAVLLKPDKGIDGNMHRRIIFKGNGKYDIKFSSYGFRSCYPVSGLQDCKYESDASDFIGLSFYGKIGDKEYSDKHEFDSEVERILIENYKIVNREELLCLSQIIDDYEKLLGKKFEKRF